MSSKVSEQEKSGSSLGVQIARKRNLRHTDEDISTHKK